MAKCLVIGGGFAGLSAAVYLSKNNHDVHLIEAAPKLGGRAYSFNYSPQNKIIDNGQHIMMGCYRYTLEFLKEISVLDKLEFQKKLTVNFIGKGGREFKLTAASVPYPINLLFAIMNYDALSSSEKFRVVKLILNLLFTSTEKLRDKTVLEWLTSEKQNDNTLKSLWEILAIGTLNASIDVASASTFAKVLKEIFFKGNKASTIILPKTGLSEMYCYAAESYIKNHGGKISLSEKLTSIDVEGYRLIKVVTNKAAYNDFDFVISTIPSYALEKVGITNSSVNFHGEFKFSPILNIHLWLDENSFSEKFYGLINSKIHWVFNHQSHITITTSAADELIELDNDKIIETISNELMDYFPSLKKSMIKEFKIIKGKRATFVPSISTELNRKKITSPYQNLILAGDWTNTGLPSTIESAVKSGVNAASLVH